MSKKTKERRRIRQQAQQRKKKMITVGVLVALIGIGVLAALSANIASQTVTFADIHGINFTDDGEQLRVSTHTGIVFYADGSWSRPSIPINDYMGYSGTSDGFFGSGHPGVGSNFVNPLGLVRSDDLGVTVRTVNFAGEADFHVMSASYYEDVVYVLSPSANSLLAAGLNYSLDGGVSWEPAAGGGLTDSPRQLAVHPSEANIVAAVTQNGLYLSQDFGESFSLIDGSNAVTTVRFDPNGESLVYGSQSLYEYNLATGESQLLSDTLDLQADQAILYVDVNSQRDELAVVTFNRDIYISFDNGQSWQQIGEDGVAK